MFPFSYTVQSTFVPNFTFLSIRELFYNFNDESVTILQNLTSSYFEIAQY